MVHSFVYAILFQDENNANGHFSFFFSTFFFTRLADALQLEIPPSTVIQGETVTVAWKLDLQDPFSSFGLMQRSLQNDQVICVVPVQNLKGDTTGDVAILFPLNG